LHPLFLLIVFIIIFIFVIAKYRWRKFIDEIKNYKEDTKKLSEEINGREA